MSGNSPELVTIDYTRPVQILQPDGSVSIFATVNGKDPRYLLTLGMRVHYYVNQDRSGQTYLLPHTVVNYAPLLKSGILWYKWSDESWMVIGPAPRYSQDMVQMSNIYFWEEVAIEELLTSSAESLRELGKQLVP